MYVFCKNCVWLFLLWNLNLIVTLKMLLSCRKKQSSQIRGLLRISHQKKLVRTLCVSLTAWPSPRWSAFAWGAAIMKSKLWFGLISLQGSGTWFLETKNGQKTSLGFIKLCWEKQKYKKQKFLCCLWRLLVWLWHSPGRWRDWLGSSTWPRRRP